MLKEQNDYINEISELETDLEEEEDGDGKEYVTERRVAGIQLLPVIQITACALILLFVLVIRLIGGQPYAWFCDWYQKEINRSIVASESVDYFQSVWNSVISPNQSVSSAGETVSQDIRNASDLGVAVNVGYKMPVISNLDGKEALLSVNLSPPLENGMISSSFGDRLDPFSGDASEHKGLDIAAPSGTSIYCVLPGVVKEAGENASYGKYLIVDHGNGVETLYAHCNELSKEKGDIVSRGDELAKVGSTGNSTGNHLHLEIRLDGQPYDPKPLLQGRYV